MAISKDKPAELAVASPVNATQGPWALFSDVRAQGSTKSCAGRFRGTPDIDIVLAKGTDIELLTGQPGADVSATSQPVFGTVLDLKTLPATTCSATDDTAAPAEVGQPRITSDRGARMHPRTEAPSSRGPVHPRTWCKAWLPSVRSAGSGLAAATDRLRQPLSACLLALTTEVSLCTISTIAPAHRRPCVPALPVCTTV